MWLVAQEVACDDLQKSTADGRPLHNSFSVIEAKYNVKHTLEA